MPTEKALQIAARVWGDRDMVHCKMDRTAAEHIAIVVDDVLKENEWGDQDMVYREIHAIAETAGVHAS